jgi:hypothetical protein
MQKFYGARRPVSSDFMLPIAKVADLWTAASESASTAPRSWPRPHKQDRTDNGAGLALRAWSSLTCPATRKAFDEPNVLVKKRGPAVAMIREREFQVGL